ncbi:MAG: DNA-directed RNA polymerase subunit omega [Spirochaetes bacterium]|nr:MAG: DNA-directed RNA polymerase subunit omega [Spirochaetota bacterium]
MILPLDKLIAYDGNIYALTCAVIRRAVQITITGDEEIQQNEGRIVSTAIKQILDRRVEYRIEE